MLSRIHNIFTFMLPFSKRIIKMIREATINDMDVIIDFQLRMAEETEGMKLNSEILKKGVTALFQFPEKGYYYVAEVDGKVVGSTMTTYEWSDWRNATMVWLQSVYVLPEYRNQKLFSKMYAHIKAKVIADESFCGIRLYVDKTNLHAQKVYKAIGMNGEHYDTYEWIK